MMSKKVRQLSKKVGQNKLSAKATVLEFFFDNPQRKITVRELAKQLKINKSKQGSPVKGISGGLKENIKKITDGA